MITFARTDTSSCSAAGGGPSTAGCWRRSCALMFCGAILVLAASPAVAERIGLDRFYLVRHHLDDAAGRAARSCFGVSTAEPAQTLRRLAVIGFAIALGLTALTLVAGSEIKGATRWIILGGFSLQPSEFLKPTFAVVAAWLFAAAARPACPCPAICIAIGALRRRRRAAAAAARPRHDRGRHRHLVRAVLPRRPADHLGRRCWSAAASPASPAPISPSPMCASASTASSIPPPATATRSTARWRPS